MKLRGWLLVGSCCLLAAEAQAQRTGSNGTPLPAESAAVPAARTWKHEERELLLLRWSLKTQSAALPGLEQDSLIWQEAAFPAALEALYAELSRAEEAQAATVRQMIDLQRENDLMRRLASEEAELIYASNLERLQALEAELSLRFHESERLGEEIRREEILWSQTLDDRYQQAAWAASQARARELDQQMGLSQAGKK